MRGLTGLRRQGMAGMLPFSAKTGQKLAEN